MVQSRIAVRAGYTILSVHREPDLPSEQAGYQSERQMTKTANRDRLWSERQREIERERESSWRGGLAEGASEIGATRKRRKVERRDGDRRAAARQRRDDKRGQENNNKETRRQDNVRRRAGVHSCFLLVRWLNLADRPASSLTLPHLPSFLPPFLSFSLSPAAAAGSHLV